MEKLKVEIDPGSGFCYGVIRAVEKAECRLREQSRLYSLGAIVHNNSELDRLRAIGLEVIDIERMRQLRDSAILIRAHGEPPSTYALAEKNNIALIDCTCPVVLKLQENIRTTYREHCTGGTPDRGQIVIFGKRGHAEVNGLIGQTGGDALIIDTVPDNPEKYSFSGIERIDYDRPVYLFSQTTKDPQEYDRVGRIIRDEFLRRSGNTDKLFIHNTICRQVAHRHANLADFARSHDVILFVSGRESSNGKVLYELCRSANPRSHHIQQTDQIRQEWFSPGESAGVCGATSTPKWQLESVARFLETLF